MEQPGDNVELTFHWRGEGPPPQQADVLCRPDGVRLQVVTAEPTPGCTCDVRALDICATVLRADAHIVGGRMYDLVAD